MISVGVLFEFSDRTKTNLKTIGKVGLGAVAGWQAYKHRDELEDVGNHIKKKGEAVIKVLKKPEEDDITQQVKTLGDTVVQKGKDITTGLIDKINKKHTT